VSGKVVGWAFEVGQRIDLTANERYVLVAVSDNADQKGKAWPSPKELIEKTGLGSSTVYRALNRFRSLELMADEEDPKGRPYFQLRVDSHGGKRPTGGKDFPQGEKDSHGGTPLIDEEPSQTSTNRSTSNDVPGDVRRIFDFWVERLGKRNPKLSDKRRARVNARLAEGFTPRELAEAISGCTLSPHNMGDNNRQRPFNDLELICRDPEHVEAFRDLHRENAKAKSGQTDVNARRKAVRKVQGLDS
jgi:DNA-binding transcriptional ArsR family regulator